MREIFDNKDYSETGRRKNIELAQQLAHFLHNKGCNVVVSLVSPYRDQRDAFKRQMGESIKEIYEASEACDESVLVFHGDDGERKGWAYIVLGNDGGDEVSDYGICDWLDDWSDEWFEKYCN